MTGPRTRPLESFDIERRKVALGQTADASAGDDTTLYTCPVQRIAIGRVYVCNRSTAATIRIRIANTTDGDQQWVVYDYPIPANEYDYTEELWLDAGSRIDVKASTATVSFTFNGYTIPKDTT